MSKKIYHLFILLLFLNSCVYYGTPENTGISQRKNQPQDTKTISNIQNQTTENIKIVVISGTDKYNEIEDDSPIKIVISGVNNTVKVLGNTNIREVVISGVDINIYLPKGSLPKISDSGTNTKIIYS